MTCPIQPDPAYVIQCYLIPQSVSNLACRLPAHEPASACCVCHMNREGKEIYCFFSPKPGLVPPHKFRSPNLFGLSYIIELVSPPHPKGQVHGKSNIPTYKNSTFILCHH